MESNIIGQIQNNEGINDTQILKLVKNKKSLLVHAVNGSLFFTLYHEEMDMRIIGSCINEININVRSLPTKQALVDIYDIKKDYPQEDTFKSLGVSLDDLCLNQHQIIDFIYSNQKRICSERQTYIPFKIEDNFFFVSVKKYKMKGVFAPVLWFGVLNNESRFFKMDNPRILVKHI